MLGFFAYSNNVLLDFMGASLGACVFTWAMFSTPWGQRSRRLGNGESDDEMGPMPTGHVGAYSLEQALVRINPTCIIYEAYHYSDATSKSKPLLLEMWPPSSPDSSTGLMEPIFPCPKGFRVINHFRVDDRLHYLVMGRVYMLDKKPMEVTDIHRCVEKAMLYHGLGQDSRIHPFLKDWLANTKKSQGCSGASVLDAIRKFITDSEERSEATLSVMHATMELVKSRVGKKYTIYREMLGDILLIYASLGRWHDIVPLLEEAHRMMNRTRSSTLPLVKVTSDMPSYNVDASSSSSWKHLDTLIMIVTSLHSHLPSLPVLSFVGNNTAINVVQMLERLGEQANEFEKQKDFSSMMMTRQWIVAVGRELGECCNSLVGENLVFIARYMNHYHHPGLTVPLFEEALAMDAQVHGAKSRKVADHLLELATCLLEARQHEECLGVLDDSLSMVSSYRANNSQEDFATMVTELAHAYERLTKDEEFHRACGWEADHPTRGHNAQLRIMALWFTTLSLLKMALDARRLMPANRAIAELLESMSKLYQDVGRFDMAWEMMEEARPIWTITNTSRADLFTKLVDLILLYPIAKKIKYADEWMWMRWGEALKLGKYTPGIDPSMLAVSLRGLAAVHVEMGSPLEAVKLLEESITILKGQTCSDSCLQLALYQNELGMCYYTTGQGMKAVSLLRGAVSITQRAGDPNPDFMANLATVLESIEQPSQATTVWKERLEITKKRGESAIMEGLALVFRSMQKYDKAADLLGKAIDMGKRDDPVLLLILVELYQDLNDHKNAALRLQQVGAAPGKTVHPANLICARLHIRAAASLEASGDHPGAQNRLSSALGMRERSLGEKSVLVGEVLLGMARCYKSMCKPIKALALMDRCMSILLEAEQPYPAVKFQEMLALEYSNLRQYTKAKKLLAKAVQMRDALGDECPASSMAMCQYHYGLLFDRMSDGAEAVRTLQSALNKWESCGTGHEVKIIMCLVSLADVFQGHKDYKKALPLAQKAVKISSALDPRRTDHQVEVVQASIQLAMAHVNLGSDLNKNYVLGAFAAAKKVLDAGHLPSTTSLYKLALLLHYSGVYKAAELTKLAIEVAEKVFGCSHPRVATYLSIHGAILSIEPRTQAEAVLFLERAITIRKNKLGTDHPAVATSLVRLSSVLIKMEAGSKARVKKLLKEAVHICQTTSSLGGEAGYICWKFTAQIGMMFDSTVGVDPDEAFAISMYEQALAGMRKMPKPGHLMHAHISNRLASLWRGKGQIDKATLLQEEAVSVHRIWASVDAKAVQEQKRHYFLVQDPYGEMEVIETLFVGHKGSLLPLKNLVHIGEGALAGALSQLVNLYTAANQHGKAIPIIQEALVIRKKKDSYNHQAVISLLRVLSTCFKQQNEFFNQIGALEEAFAVVKAGEKPGTGNNSDASQTSATDSAVATADTLWIANELAAAHKKLGQIDRAKGVLHELCDILKSTPDYHHKDLAAALHQRGMLSHKQQKKEEALPLMEGAVGEGRLATDLDGPTMLVYLHNLSVILWDVGKTSRAVTVQEEVVERERGLPTPTNQSGLASRLSRLAGMYRKTNQATKALDVLVEVLSIQRTLSEGLHLDLLPHLSKLATVYEEQGQEDRSQPMYEEMVTIMRANQCTQRPDYAMACARLAGLYTDIGRMDDARSLLEESLRSRLTAPTFEAAAVAKCLAQLAVHHQNMGEFQYAKGRWTEALEVMNKHLKGNHANIINCLHNVGLVHLALGEPIAGKGVLEKAVHMARQVLGPQHVDLGVYIDSLASAHEMFGNLHQSVPLRKEALEIWNKAWGRDS